MNTEKRCDWCKGDVLYQHYHDTEWGVPLFDEQRLFEFLILETFQAGLSWITILRKRENFRRAFDQFDYHKIARYDDVKITALLSDTGIVRNRLKVHAAVENARAYLEIQNKFGSFSEYYWGFTEGKPIQNTFTTLDEIPATTPLAEKISKDLKKNGFRFVGPTIVYAHMQATGMVNDHMVDCFRYHQVMRSC